MFLELCSGTLDGANLVIDVITVARLVSSSIEIEKVERTEKALRAFTTKPGRFRHGFALIGCSGASNVLESDHPFEFGSALEPGVTVWGRVGV